MAPSTPNHRKAWETEHGPYAGPVEIDESYFGGKEKNKIESRKGSPKTTVVGARDRASNQIVTQRSDNGTI